MAVIILPDAQAQLLSLQDYMLKSWSQSDWLKAEDEIFEKLEKIDSGQFNGSVIHELASVGIQDFKNAYTSHHKIVYKRFGKDTFVYLIASHKQDFPTLLSKIILGR
jgi:hypothetical protein